MGLNGESNNAYRLNTRAEAQAKLASGPAGCAMNVQPEDNTDRAVRLMGQFAEYKRVVDLVDLLDDAEKRGEKRAEARALAEDDADRRAAVEAVEEMRKSGEKPISWEEVKRRIGLSQQAEQTIVLEQEEDGGFSVYTPGVPGCTSQGDTIAEAVSNIAEAIDLHIGCMKKDGLPISTSAARLLEAARKLRADQSTPTCPPGGIQGELPPDHELVVETTTFVRRRKVAT